MFGYFKEHWQNRHQILYLAKSDLIKTNRGSMLGWVWELVQPLIMIGVYWFVFKIGWRVGGSREGVDYLSWLMAGIVAWYFINDMLSKGTNSFREYRYLVTKMKFPIVTIPSFVTLSKLAIHVLLVAVVMAFLAHRGHFSIYWLQLPFYTILMAAFFVAWSLFASPLASISKDFSRLVRSASRILFWLSGVLFNINSIHNPWIKNILLFNPISFFVEGYRNSLVEERWFFDQPLHLLGFSLTFVLMIILAAVIYQRSRKELVDAL